MGGGATTGVDGGGHEGAHASDHSGSVFRVGDNVELERVLAMVSVLVVCVMVLERSMHRLEHKLHKYPKYHEMMTKVFGELMVLGLIGLGIKILKELGKLDAYSKPMIAFQAADLTIFIVAMALILQAIVVFLTLRRKNIQSDKAELISTQHLVDHIAQSPKPTWFSDFAALFTFTRRSNRTELTKADIPEVVQLRILRHKFLNTYGLPELFPFSKYLRQAQDNQISHMIEVEISTWIVLLLIAWGLGGVSKLVAHKYDTHYSILVAFLLFSWLAVMLHIALASYFTWAIDQLVNAAVDAPTGEKNRFLFLNEIAELEAQRADRDFATDAIAVMERVREHEQLKRVQRKRNVLSEHDTGFQLVGTIFRKVKSGRNQAPKPEDEEERMKQGNGVDADGEPVPMQGAPIQLRWFSRKAWHFVVMSTMMLNALYVALFCQCLIYQMHTIYEEYGWAIMAFIPSPLVINVFIFQPRILRNYILVSSIVRIDDTALGDVIDHFTGTVQLRASFVQTVHAYLNTSNQSLSDILTEFEMRDSGKTGLLDAEEVRLVLRRFGFKLSYFKFNSVAKLLFEFHGTNIQYVQVIRLLEIGDSDDVRALANSTAFMGEATSSDSFAFPVLEHAYTLSPYITNTHGSARSRPPTGGAGPTAADPNRPLLRAKSSAARSLYRMYVDGPLQTQSSGLLQTQSSGLSTPQTTTTPGQSTEYVRM